jgi:hypothetical protein
MLIAEAMKLLNMDPVVLGAFIWAIRSTFFIILLALVFNNYFILNRASLSSSLSPERSRIIFYIYEIQ